MTRSIATRQTISKMSHNRGVSILRCKICGKPILAGDEIWRTGNKKKSKAISHFKCVEATRI